MENESEKYIEDIDIGEECVSSSECFMMPDDLNENPVIKENDEDITTENANDVNTHYYKDLNLEDEQVSSNECFQVGDI